MVRLLEEKHLWHEESKCAGGNRTSPHNLHTSATPTHATELGQQPRLRLGVSHGSHKECPWHGCLASQHQPRSALSGKQRAGDIQKQTARAVQVLRTQASWTFMTWGYNCDKAARALHEAGSAPAWLMQQSDSNMYPPPDIPTAQFW